MSSPVTITVTYNGPLLAPSNTKTFTVPTSTPAATANSKQAEQTAHVKAARGAVVRVQDEVNKYLTERMEEEKRLSEGKVDMKEENEDVYGEEVLEE
jgi:hypothetical protein